MTPADLTLNHWIIAPVVIPALLAPLILLAMRHDLVLQRIAGLAGAGAIAAAALVLFAQGLSGRVQSYELGAWPAPFGIVLVLDRLSALMVLLTAGLGLVTLVYAVATGWDARGRHFHALWQFQLMGLMGAMLTGDIFNLFVFFEILLIASYGLMVHGGGAMRLRGGVQYVVYNLAGSTLFLFALGTIYATLGTLNMADLAERAAVLPEGDTGLLRLAAALLLAVFLIKGALIPLHFWLPNTYALAPAPVAALFAVMTKVGAYAVIRVWTLVFPGTLAAAGDIAAAVLIPGGLITLAVGMTGVLAGGTLARVAAFAGVGSMGTLFLTLGAFTPQATAAALYYLVHSTLAAAILFLVVDQVRARRGASRLDLRPAMPGSGLIAALFMGAAIATTGLPPLSGFVGKLLVLDALADHPLWVWIWAIVLVTSLIAVVGFARAGSTLFWKAHAIAPQGADAAPSETRHAALADQPRPGLALGMAGTLLAGTAALTVFAGPALQLAEATAAQLHARTPYIEAVLRPRHRIEALIADPDAALALSPAPAAAGTAPAGTAPAETAPAETAPATED
jgi:multicomponent K+:H+ antiporter subunit D